MCGCDDGIYRSFLFCLLAVQMVKIVGVRACIIASGQFFALLASGARAVSCPDLLRLYTRKELLYVHVKKLDFFLYLRNIFSAGDEFRRAFLFRARSSAAGAWPYCSTRVGLSLRRWPVCAGETKSAGLALFRESVLLRAKESSSAIKKPPSSA